MYTVLGSVQRVDTCFYRVTLCVSAFFTAIRTGVRPFACHVGDCIHTAEDIVKLLLRPGRPITVVFDPVRRYPVPRGTMSAGVQNTRGWENWPFSTEIAVYL